MPEPSAEPRPLGAAWSALALAAAFALIERGADLLRPAARPLASTDRVMHFGYAAGHALALGVLSFALLRGWARLEPRAPRHAGVILLAVVAWAAAYPLLATDFATFAARITEAPAAELALLYAMVFGLASAVPLAAVVGARASSPRARGLALAAALLGMAASPFVLTAEYDGIRLYVPAAAATLGGAALATTPVRPRPNARRIAGVLLGASALAGAWAVLTRPPEIVAISMIERGDVLARHVARARARRWSTDRAEVPAALAPWLDRSGAPDVPPTPIERPSGPIVILYSVDALRADVIASGRHDRLLPTFARLRREGAAFTRARSPGTGTEVSVASMFTGTYFSELYWSRRVGPRAYYPWEDHTPRLAELLARHGVATASFVPSAMLTAEYGVARGFAEERRIEARPDAAIPSPLGSALLARLARHGEGPLFAWIHDVDPHTPYDLAGTHGTPRDAYLREVALVDAELAQLVELVEARGWTERVTLIVTADHGEAFGEHGHRFHGVSLYDELLRVPLLVVGPGVRPRAIRVPVTLMDLGPTILDLFGAPTPGRWLGESLLPHARGEDRALTRPIAAETRLLQALVLPDGTKLLRDLRHGTREIYDLGRDPRELTNLFDEGDRRRRAEIDLLTRFFEAHTLRRPGYEPPYRR